MPGQSQNIIFSGANAFRFQVVTRDDLEGSAQVTPHAIEDGSVTTRFAVRNPFRYPQEGLVSAHVLGEVTVADRLVNLEGAIKAMVGTVITYVTARRTGKVWLESATVGQYEGDALRVTLQMSDYLEAKPQTTTVPKKRLKRKARTSSPKKKSGKTQGGTSAVVAGVTATKIVGPDGKTRYTTTANFGRGT
jgi:hypothetical protein